MEYNLIPLVREAIARFGGESEGLFTTAAFQQSVRDEFDLPAFPDGQWCESVLSSIPGIVKLACECYWAYRPSNERS